MKVLFLMDNGEYVEVAPEKLQIRQLQEGLAALGTEVIIPVKKEGTTTGDFGDSMPEMQVGFRPFINYRVNISIPLHSSGAPDGSAPGSESLVGDCGEVQLGEHPRWSKAVN